MKHTTRQAVSFLLVLILCLGLFPVTALADTDDSVSVVDLKDALSDSDLEPMPYYDGILFDMGVFPLGAGELYGDPDNLSVGTAYAKLYKIRTDQPVTLNVAFYGMREDIDTVILMYREENGTMEFIKSYDSDNQDSYRGEEHWLFLDGGQTYGLALAGYDKEETGDCGVYLYGTTMTHPQDQRMDLTPADPELTQGDFWKWDVTGKTLTLKDGFVFNYVGTGPAILLPGGSTVKVNGGAKVNSWGDGIRCADGNSTLTILGDGLDDSLSILAQEDGVYGPGGSQVKVQNCNLGIRAGENGIHTYGLLVEDSYLYIESGDDGVESYGTRNMVINDSTVVIHAGDDGLDCNKLDDSIGSIIVSGGGLYFNVHDCTLIAKQVVLTDVTYDLRAHYGWFFRLKNEDDFVLPGLLCMYDREGNKRYSGEWPENYNPLDNPLDVCRVASAFRVTVENGYEGTTGAGLYVPDETVFVSAGSRSSYRFRGWTAEGVELDDGTGKEISFSMPDNNVTVSAIWSKKSSSSNSASSGSTGQTTDQTTEPAVPEEPQEESGKTFDDVAKTAWYSKAVEYVSARGILNGTGERTFRPDGTVSRGMLVTALYNLSGKPAPEESDGFDDVADGRWYSDAVLWASQQGIVSGYGNGNFRPNDPITREQLAVVLWKLAGSPDSTQSLDGFGDAAQISGYAQTAMQWANEMEILNGSTGGLLNPQGEATRGEVAQMLMTFCETFAKK